MANNLYNTSTIITAIMTNVYSKNIIDICLCNSISLIIQKCCIDTLDFENLYKRIVC